MKKTFICISIFWALIQVLLFSLYINTYEGFVASLFVGLCESIMLQMQTNKIVLIVSSIVKDTKAILLLDAIAIILSIGFSFAYLIFMTVTGEGYEVNEIMYVLSEIWFAGFTVVAIIKFVLDFKQAKFTDPDSI